MIDNEKGIQITKVVMAMAANTLMAALSSLSMGRS
jgi:hypothetical protein